VALDWSKEISNYGLDNYIQDNIDIVKRNEFWQKAKEEIIDEYINKVKEDYNISLSENELRYETELLYTININ
jgi:transcriptional regulatory protein LevR